MHAAVFTAFICCSMMAITFAAPTTTTTTTTNATTAIASTTEKKEAVQYRFTIEMVHIYMCPRFCNPTDPYFKPFCVLAKKQLLCRYCQFGYKCGRSAPKTHVTD